MRVGAIAAASRCHRRSVLLQHVVADEILRVLLGNVPRIAAPTIRFEPLHPLRFAQPSTCGNLDRVEMDVPGQCQQVRVVLDQLGLESSLELVPGLAVLVACIEGVAGIQPLHELRQIGPRRACQEMEMIVHQDIGVQQDGERVEIVAKLAEKPPEVVFCPENLRPPVPTGRNVVDRIRKVDPWWACHSGSIARLLTSVKCKVKCHATVS